jgi:hypothetical protein
MVAYWWPGEKDLFAGAVSKRRPDISAAGANRPEEKNFRFRRRLKESTIRVISLRALM